MTCTHHLPVLTCAYQVNTCAYSSHEFKPKINITGQKHAYALADCGHDPMVLGGQEFS